MCLIAYFTSDRKPYFFQDQGLIDYGIVLGICSELLMRLSSYIHLGYGKSFRLTWESNPGPSEIEASALPIDPSANS